MRRNENIDPVTLDRLKTGEELYQYRNRIACIVGRLELADLKRLHSLIVRLSDADLRAVARYAEGLAEWPDPDASSSNGAKAITP